MTGSVLPLAVDAFDSDGRAVSAIEGRVLWMSSSSDIAHVDAMGFLVSSRPGQVTVSARYVPPCDMELRSELSTSTTALRIVPAPTTKLVIDGPEAVETGEAAELTTSWPDAYPRWSVEPSGATIDPTGVFVAAHPGVYLVQAIVGNVSSVKYLNVKSRRVRRDVKVVGRAPVTDRLSADLSVLTRGGRTYVYLGTASNAVLVFDVTDPTRPILTDSLLFNARYVLDVSVNGDGSLLAVSREGAADRRNGVVLLDLEDPAHPRTISEFTETLTGGVHNTMFDGPYLYATHNGDGALHVLDVRDPRQPREVGEWHTGTPGRYLHDVFVRDGIAYLAYWEEGLVILDVGGADRGGTPSRPEEIARVVFDFDSLYGPVGVAGTHSVFASGDRVYVGDHVTPALYALEQPLHPRGFVHVLDVSDLGVPREVARYAVPEAGAHNFQVEGDRLYVAYYDAGVRIVDVSGDVKGDLYGQGREIASFITDAADRAFATHRAFAFGVQPLEERIYISDMYSGLWILILSGDFRPSYPFE